MSFSFNFADQDELEDESIASDAQNPIPDRSDRKQDEGKEENDVPCQEWKLQDLLDNLPPRISYSPLKVSLDSSGSSITIYRRDLFDARFQELLTEGDEDQEDEETESTLRKGDANEENIKVKKNKGKETAPLEESSNASSLASTTTDLIPGVYEGGFKTWECSLDLVATLEEYSKADQDWIKGKSIVELGCGTALPSVYLLQKLFSSSQNETASSTTKLHLCDFNSQVLRLVTLPNLILAWYFSPASVSYKQDHESQATQKQKQITSDDPVPGDLALSEELLSAFLSSLKTRSIELKFFSGSWSSFNRHQTESQEITTEKYDLILTSETIYSLKTMSSLISVLQRSSKFNSKKANDSDAKSITTQLESTTLSSEKKRSSNGDSLCLVAAKVLYFGVGGGVQAFESAIRDQDGWTEEVRRIGKGVGRVVLSVGF